MTEQVRAPEELGRAGGCGELDGGVGEEWSVVPAHTCTNDNYII